MTGQWESLALSASEFTMENYGVFQLVIDLTFWHLFVNPSCCILFQ